MTGSGFEDATDFTQLKLKNRAAGNLSYILGSSTSRFAPADFDNDGKVDAAVFDNGAGKYEVEPNNPLATEYTISLGQSGDFPVPANFGGDARADAAVFRPSTGAWYIQITGGSSYSTSFGTSGDIPVVGDYDGDGVADLAVFRPSTGYCTFKEVRWIFNLSLGTFGRCADTSRL